MGSWSRFALIPFGSKPELVLPLDMTAKSQTLLTKGHLSCLFMTASVGKNSLHSGHSPSILKPNYSQTCFVCLGVESPCVFTMAGSGNDSFEEAA